MKQKRQQFQKQIRREALQKIFRKKRELCFNLNSNSQSLTNNTQSLSAQLSQQCTNQLSRYSQQLHDGLSTQNIQGILTSVKDSYYQMKRIIVKCKQNDSIIRYMGENWFKYGFDKLLFLIVKMFQRIDKNSYCVARKQIYRYSVMHFHLILRQLTTIGAHIKSKEIFNYLFLSILELSNLPESINQIILIVTYLINQSKQMRHEFLFQNYKLQQQRNEQLLSFEHVVYIIFQNREKFKTTMTVNNSNFDDNQEKEENGRIYRDIKMNFIYLFREYGYEMKQLEKYIAHCAKYKEERNNNTQNQQHSGDDQIDIVYENSLRLHGYPSQIKLRNFLQKQTLTIITQTINQQRLYYLSQWPTSPSHQQSLSQCLQATRLLLDYTHNPRKLLHSLQDQLNDIISLLTIHTLNIQVKNQTLYLIDSIIYSDQENGVVEYLVRDCNLFEKLWSYQQQGVFAVKMNAVNNLLLCTAGFHAVNRYLSDIIITLHGTQKFIPLALTFINNYFVNTKFDLHPKSRVDLLIELLYSLPKENFNVENLQHECYILSHLYDNGFSRRLPERYEEWGREMVEIGKEKVYERLDEENLYIIASKMLDIYAHYANQSSSAHFMQYE